MNPQPAAIMSGGLFGPGFLCCQAISGGAGWTMIGEEIRLVYVDDAAGNFDDLMPAALGAATGGAITIPISLTTEAVTQFKQAGVSPGGTIGEMSDALALEVDAAGNIVGPVGNNPSELTATPLAGGTIHLAWEYDRTDEPATPTGFKVYRFEGGGWALYDTVALTENRLRYDLNVSKQTWTSGAFAHDTATQWQVRTYKTIGVTDYERLADAPEVSATADAQGPTAVTGLTLGVPG